MASNVLIPQSGITAQPVSAFLKGRAMRMAYETDKQEMAYRQMQMEELPKQAEFNRQLQVAELQQQQQKFQAEQQATRAKGMYGALLRAAESDDVTRELNMIAGTLGAPPVQGLAPEEARANALQMARGLEVQYGFEPPKVDEPKYGVTRITSGDELLTFETQDGRPVGEPMARAPRYKPAAAGGESAGPKPLTVAERRENRIAQEKADTRKAKAATNLRSLEGTVAVADTILSMAEKGIDQSNKFNTGVASKLPGYKELPNVVNLQATLDTVKANLGFQELKKMRFESPTGGALGQVAVKEIEFLQSTVASMRADQGEEQLDANLRIIIDRYKTLKETIEKAMEAEQLWLQEQDDAEIDDLVSQYAG